MTEPLTSPRTLGLRRSFGFGDRLGLATPGHIAAIEGSTFAPVFAQQSIREMTRTNRTADEVMRCAINAISAAKYTGDWGADGDHLQTPEDVATVASSGFCFFTIDPSAHVDCTADSMPADDLASALAAQVTKASEWCSDFGSADEAFTRTADLYLNKTFNIADGIDLTFDDPVTLRRAVVKYGIALYHAARMSRVIAETSSDRPFELELSVDETDTPTTPCEHLFIGLELRRLGVEVVSLAPRFIGDFEKGVDYRGDLDAFTEDYRTHAAIAKYCGPYKLSIHSGSDKFTVYPIMGRISGEHLHVKTAGTSYLEALRVMARVDPALFREVVEFSRGRFETDRATYHISGRLDQVSAEPSAEDLEPAYLDRDDGRQILHVTFGSVLTSPNTGFKDKLLGLLDKHEDLHCEFVARHLGRHIEQLELG